MTHLPAGYRAVDLDPSRHADVVGLDTWAFPSSVDDDVLLGLPSPLTWERARGVQTDDGELVAVHASYPFSRFPVPGARVPVAGLTWVGVHPAHRRRGLLRAMIHDHVARSLARGEAVSALYAAEPAIYGRFGYGVAAYDVRLTVPRTAALRPVPGADQVRVRLERVEERHDQIVQALHEAVDRPGWATRETPELRAAYLDDPPAFRNGAEALRIAVAERDGRPVGYAFFRRKSDWGAAGPRGTVRVRDLVAEDPAVARALWGVLLDLDLMATTEAWVTQDDALLHLLVDLRATEPRLTDNVWVRLLDVPAALAARRYSTDVDVVLEVRDDLVPANSGRWRLEGGADGAVVTPVDRSPDLVLDVRELGAAYLGGPSLASLAAAGLVTAQRPAALARAATAFGWPVPPGCSWVF
ncbi:GNAT family N-acetyltransferase [Actinotalea sp. Marseille-Q4924]|uniref:GNAT family N-acetyltransferase n=1 Tax=Actinotalea sp. Marseille-Q4924 TaxID=2866571 RepID=UPI001CE498A7|nr:GNAT family N-acetyltransferase [Actinotalea sp. Marseille-Q4924]